MCTIYSIRPGDCAEFPHLTKKQMKHYMHVHHQNVVYCPATLKWVEKLKSALQSVQLNGSAKLNGSGELNGNGKLNGHYLNGS